MHTSQRTPRALLLAVDRQQSPLFESFSEGVQRQAYTPYGWHSRERQLQTQLGFNGQLREHSSVVYMLGNGYRAYNPVLMRFNSSDHFSPFGKGGLNAYAYCAGSPVNRIDPSGASWLALLGQGVGSLLNAIFAGAAINRAAATIVSGIPSPMTTRVGNVLSFWGGAGGLPSRMLGVPSSASAALPTSGISIASNAGVIGTQVLTGAGAVAQNHVIAKKWWATAGTNGQSRPRVVWEAVKEASGWNLLRRQPPGQVPSRSPEVPLQDVVVETRRT
ncbi:RHS repeat-associated core domain-containing protein [Pseudomonas sp. R5(2019)]|uniref:RHS repeat-associated core domain-containing protein n=1 Tax=Pseudomonas sp. R5(2019) TaxID=2697566 RepID=UPI001412F518|nr:RHS repeat-associated core domain-containing protein [Pseudomonas sp. R5(2019)]NBA96401.1 hypothetical protein [Pseudomonas sp. R5(2019)]